MIFRKDFIMIEKAKIDRCYNCLEKMIMFDNYKFETYLKYLK